MNKIAVLFFVFIHAFLNAQTGVDQLIDSLTLVDSHSEKSRLSQEIAKALKDSDWKRTLKYLDYAEEEAEISESRSKTLMKFYISAANVYYDKDVLDVSLKYFQKAYNLIDDQEDSQEKMILENELAVIYARLNNHDKALLYFKKVYQFQLKEKDSTYLTHILNNIGTLYLESNNDSSLVYYKKALDFVTIENDPNIYAYLYTNLGRVYHLGNDTLNARNYFKKSIDITASNVDKRTKSFVFHQLSNYYLDHKQIDSTIHYASKAAEMLKENTYSFDNQDVLQILYKAYLKKEDYQNASVYFEQYNAIRDSINLEEKAVNVERLKLEQEFKHKEQIRALEDSRKKSSYLIIGLSLVSGLLFLIILLIKYKNRLVKVKLEKEFGEVKRKELITNLELKNRVLVGKAMTEIHRTEIIHSILEDLKHVKLKAVKKETQQAIGYILRRLEHNTNSNIWEEFEVSFEQVHHTFYKNLNDKHPNLTSKDRRLCALLILNLTSKEISQVTGQSFKSVENARTRLRKKLELTNTKTDLTSYLNSLN